jgi:hypothetical protein
MKTCWPFTQSPFCRMRNFYQVGVKTVWSGEGANFDRSSRRACNGFVVYPPTEARDTKRP